MNHFQLIFKTKIKNLNLLVKLLQNKKQKKMIIIVTKFLIKYNKNCLGAVIYKNPKKK